MTADRSSPAPILDLINAFRWSKVMFTAVSMGIFDILHGRDAAIAELTAETKAEAGALERLLDAACALGLLRKKDGRYRNTEVAERYLRRGSPETLTGYILYSDRILFRLWGDLQGAVEQGTNRWGSVFGGRVSLFDNFFATEEAKREFIAGMHGFGLISSPAVAAAFDLARFNRVVDLGGATGHLALAIAGRYPHMRAAVFDLPEVCDVAREYVQHRAEVLGGDFFSHPLPPADLYTMGRILHDWPDEKVSLLLGRIYEALPAGGALLIAEQLLEPDKTAPLPGLMQSLNMLVCTEGKERTLAEYTMLLRSAGFSAVDGRRTGTPLDAVLAVK
jgi:acetylserotonin O-methyltransferase